MVAIILCAGRGKRLGDVTDGNKCMIRINNKPLIERTIEMIADIEIIDKIIIVIGYKGNEIRNYIGDRYGKKKIKYIVQNELNGIVGAIRCAKEQIDKKDFFLLLGDEYLENPQYGKMISIFLKYNYLCLLGVVRVDDRELIKKTYTFTYNSRMQVNYLIEKPEKSFNNFMGTGNIIFKNEILCYIEKAQINKMRGEQELVDLIQTGINDKKTVKFFELSNYYINLNHMDDYIELKNIEKSRSLHDKEAIT